MGRLGDAWGRLVLSGSVRGGSAARLSRRRRPAGQREALLLGALPSLGLAGAAPGSRHSSAGARCRGHGWSRPNRRRGRIARAPQGGAVSTRPASPVFAWRNAVLADAALSPMGRLVALVLSVHMNGERGSCFPGIRLLMTQTALKRTAVYDHLSELERAGWLGAEQQPGRGGPHGYVGTFPDD